MANETWEVPVVHPVLLRFWGRGIPQSQACNEGWIPRLTVPPPFHENAVQWPVFAILFPAYNTRHLILQRGNTPSSLSKRCPTQDPHLLAHLDRGGPPPCLRPSPFGSSGPWESSTIDCRRGYLLVLQWNSSNDGRETSRDALISIATSQTSPTWGLNSPFHGTNPLGYLINLTSKENTLLGWIPRSGRDINQTA